MDCSGDISRGEWGVCGLTWWLGLYVLEITWNGGSPGGLKEQVDLLSWIAGEVSVCVSKGGGGVLDVFGPFVYPAAVNSDLAEMFLRKALK